MVYKIVVFYIFSFKSTGHIILFYLNNGIYLMEIDLLEINVSTIKNV